MDQYHNDDRWHLAHPPILRIFRSIFHRNPTPQAPSATAVNFDAAHHRSHDSRQATYGRVTHPSNVRDQRMLPSERLAPPGVISRPAPGSSTFGTSLHKSCNSPAEVGDACNNHIFISSEPRVPHMFKGAQKVDIGGNAKFMNIAGNNVTNNWHDGTHGLEKMERFVSFSAQFDSSAQDPERVCHPGTRQNVLKQIEDWVDHPNSTERIFWLHGPAGAGKSAIAQTFAQSCGQPKVAATFFFYRSDPSRNDGNKLFTTLSYQLAFSIPAIKDYIVQSLQERPDLPMKSIEKQFEYLIARPFRFLTEATSEQSCPLSLTTAVNQCQRLAPVIIIDGVDECKDEKLQQRFLKIIGNAIKDPAFPFRFLICSRPEAHIEDALNEFRTSTLLTDLAKLDDANRDIEKYLVDEFSRIASIRGLDSAWPGRGVIQDIIYKSSGNFIFASVVIKFVDDEDSIPENQLDIVLNLKPPERMSPFTVLDELYLEILRRQPYQEFLKTFLAILVGRTALSGEDLHEDDATLMDISKRELHTKLRRMRSLLKFDPHIDVHHKSFLDFLNERSRSGDYCVSKRAGARRYVELVVDSIVRYTPRLIENLDYHKTHHHHHSLKFIDIAGGYPLKIHLSIEELQEISEPLIPILDKVLKLAVSKIANEILFCHKCTTFRIMHHLLLHLAMRRCIDFAHNQVVEPVTAEKNATPIPSVQTNLIQRTFGNDLDSSLFALFAQLREPKLELLQNVAIINHTCAVLQFDSVETAMKVQSMSDAQRLVDLLVQLIDEKHVLNQNNATRNAACLVLNIFVRVPVLPRSLLVNVQRITSSELPLVLNKIRFHTEAALMRRVLDQNYIRLDMDLQERFPISTFAKDMTFTKWQLDPITIIELVLEVAKAIQYLHFVGIVPGDKFHIGNLYLDLNLCPRVRISPKSFGLINHFEKSTNRQSSYEDSVFAFGCFFYQAYFYVTIDYMTIIRNKRQSVVERPSSPKIPENMWQLIQHCCAEDPKERPTIDEVVKEMEMWICKNIT